MFFKNFLSNLYEGERKSSFHEKEQESMKRTHKIFKDFTPLYERSLSVLMRIVDILVVEVEEREDLAYNKAALILLNRSIQHAESIRVLNAYGLYGNAISIVRSVMGDMNMLQYLHFHPELVEKFLQEGADEYQTNPEFKKLFNEYAVEKDLESRGRKSHLDSFYTLSKTIHPSSWGSQLYGRRVGKGKYSLKYGPGFEGEKSLAILLVLATIYYDFIVLILHHRHHDKRDLSFSEWEDIKSSTRKLRQEVDDFCNHATRTLVRHKKKVESTEQSIEG